MLSWRECGHLRAPRQGCEEAAAVGVWTAQVQMEEEMMVAVNTATKQLAVVYMAGPGGHFRHTMLNGTRDCDLKGQRGPAIL